MSNIERQISEQIQQLADGSTLLEVAQACRASNFHAVECAPQLYLLFPTTLANDMGSVLVQTWACELSSADLTTALQSCLTQDGSAAYTPQQIADSVAANISLTYLDCAHVPIVYGGTKFTELMMIGLSQGNLVGIKPAEAARFIIISCLPGDYTPTDNSLIAAVQNAYGISVAQMAQNPAADYRSTLNCWISQSLSTYTTQPVPYQQLICFESTGAAAPGNIPNVFAAIKQYIPTPPPVPETGPTIVSAMLSTGGAGADPSQVLTALFDSCWNLMTGGTGYNMTCFRIDVFQTSWVPQLTALFETLRQSHGG